MAGKAGQERVGRPPILPVLGLIPRISCGYPSAISISGKAWTVA